VRALVGDRLEALTRRIDELLALRDELQQLVGEWDRRLEGTPPGQRAHLLEGLGDTRAIERARRRSREARDPAAPGRRQFVR
jgi:hypothetical protein